MKTPIVESTRFIKPLDRPFLMSVGSAIDLMGFTFAKIKPDLSTGFQRDAEAIWHDFMIVGMDIQKSTAVYQTSTPKDEE